MKLLAIGEIIWDCYENGEVIGGAPFNFCAHAAHFGDEAYLLSAVGKDALGQSAVACAEKYGIRTGLLQYNDRPTGACIVTLDENKVPTFNVLSGTAYDAIRADTQTMDAVRALNADVLYFGTLIQREGTSRDTVKSILEYCRFREIFCDINIRKNCYDKESVVRCLEHATLLKISEEEMHVLRDFDLVSQADLPETLRLLAAEYTQLKVIIITLGRNGSVAYDVKAGQIVSSPRPADVTVVSTVGAGDSFGARFLHEYMAGAPVGQCLARATETGDFVVSCKEAVPY